MWESLLDKAVVYILCILDFGTLEQLYCRHGRHLSARLFAVLRIIINNLKRIPTMLSIISVLECFAPVFSARV
jgi:hypothetical protein